MYPTMFYFFLNRCKNHKFVLNTQRQAIKYVGKYCFDSIYFVLLNANLYIITIYYINTTDFM